jgi:hypothetical protein
MWADRVAEGLRLAESCRNTIIGFDERRVSQHAELRFALEQPTHLSRICNPVPYRCLSAWRQSEQGETLADPSQSLGSQRLLDRVADNRAKDAARDRPNSRVTAGTVLIREWGGVRHRVTALDHDVVYQGRRYQSLSEVARAITGTRWSGPRFFGLKGRIKEAVND